MTKSRSVGNSNSTAQPLPAPGGIPLAGTENFVPPPHQQQILHSQSVDYPYPNDTNQMLMPIAGHNLETYDQPLAVVRLIDFNNFEDKDEIDEESLMGIRNLRNKFYEQITMS